MFDRSLPTTLPSSKSEVNSLIFVGFLTGAVAFARICYGKDDLSWRRTFGTVTVAMSVGMGTYAIGANLTPLSGYMAVAIATGCGLFLEDGLRRFHDKFFGPENGPDSGEK